MNKPNNPASIPPRTITPRDPHFTILMNSSFGSGMTACLRAFHAVCGTSLSREFAWLLENWPEHFNDDWFESALRSYEERLLVQATERGFAPYFDYIEGQHSDGYFRLVNNLELSKIAHTGKLVRLPPVPGYSQMVGYGYGYEVVKKELVRLKIPPMEQPIFWPVTNQSVGIGQNTREQAMTSLELHLQSTGNTLTSVCK